MPNNTASPPWLLLVHQLPPKPSNLRVRIWRRLQELGAVALKNSVYVLPNSAEAREDLEWLRSEVVGLGGEATVFAAQSPGDLPRQSIVELFQRARAEDYQTLASEMERLRTQGAAASGSARRAQERALRKLRQRLAAIERVDFFGAPGGRELARRLDTFERALQRPAPIEVEPASTLAAKDFRRRRWTTRPRPGVDRMASAWLIRRSIDPDAKFQFADSPTAAGAATAFDMFGGAFAHQGDACTFEVLQRRFALVDPALDRVAEIVHDCDLRTDRHGTAERPAVDRLVAGLRLAYADDTALLHAGMTVFEALYRSFADDGSPPRPRGRRNEPASTAKNASRRAPTRKRRGRDGGA